MYFKKKRLSTTVSMVTEFECRDEEQDRYMWYPKLYIYNPSVSLPLASKSLKIMNLQNSTWNIHLVVFWKPQNSEI